MVATVGRIRRHGFGPRRYFETLICRRGKVPVGLALYYFTYSTFLGRPTLYLEDLFVLPKERGNGAGKALLRELAAIAVRRGCGRMEWTVLDWNTPARDFYFKLGAVAMDEWTVFRMTPEAFGRLAREGTGSDLPDEAVQQGEAVVPGFEQLLKDIPRVDCVEFDAFSYGLIEVDPAAAKTTITLKDENGTELCRNVLEAR